MVLNSLPSNLTAFIQNKISAGEFATPDDVVCHALRLLQGREERLQALRAEIQIGLDEFERGEFGPVDLEDTKARLFQRLDEANRTE